MDKGSLLVAITHITAKYKSALIQIKEAGVSEDASELIDGQIAEYERILSNGFDSYINEAVQFSKENFVEALEEFEKNKANKIDTTKTQD